MTGQRVSIWIPDDKRWLLKAIERVQKQFEEAGVPKSRAEVILVILEAELKKYRNEVETDSSMSEAV